MKKIMFSTKYGLEQAVLDGHKTMTRRAVVFNGKTYEKAYGDLISIQGTTFRNCLLKYSAYKVGELVAIAQSYNVAQVTCLDYLRATDNKGDSYTDGFFNKMFVKAELMPHHIRITNIRIERLQDISYEDCLREGVVNKGCVFGLPNIFGGYNSARLTFAALIDKVSGKGTWERNPYVFVYDFELVD